MLQLESEPSRKSRGKTWNIFILLFFFSLSAMNCAGAATAPPLAMRRRWNGIRYALTQFTPAHASHFRLWTNLFCFPGVPLLLFQSPNSSSSNDAECGKLPCATCMNCFAVREMFLRFDYYTHYCYYVFSVVSRSLLEGESGAVPSLLLAKE